MGASCSSPTMLHILLFSVALSAQVHFKVAACPDGFIPFPQQGSCFHLITERLTWPDAKNECEGMDANLASIQSLEEMDFVQKLAYDSLGKLPVWLGGVRFDFVWEWTDGTPFDFKYWAKGMPEDNPEQECIVFIPYKNWNGGWMNYYCDATHFSMCKVDLM